MIYTLSTRRAGLSGMVSDMFACPIFPRGKVTAEYWQVSHIATGTFYNNTHGEDIEGPKANDKCSIHYWNEHGMAGRGILLDYLSYAQKNGVKYDSFEAHRIPLNELEKCGKDQGIDIRPESQGGDIKVGDLLFIRSGFTQAYYSSTPEERKKAAIRPHHLGPDDGQRWAGVEQSEEMLDWLHDCYFAAVAGDTPSFEAWPSDKGGRYSRSELENY